MIQGAVVAGAPFVLTTRLLVGDGLSGTPRVAILDAMDERQPSSVRRTIGARTGGRSQRVVSTVLRVAAEEIARLGYAAFRVEHVAERAGVNKTTVYRRWPTKTDLAEAALLAFLGQQAPLPDTGSVRADLVEMARRAIMVASTPEGRAFIRLVAVESAEPEVNALGCRVRTAMMEHRTGVVVRAQRRGELPAGIDARVLLDAIFVPILSRVGRYQEEVDPTTLEAFVDLALSGAQHGAARGHQEAC
jgi:AcrR family transcriptional regulator